MNARSVFFEEWLNSLREHYKHVLRAGDRVTEPSLTAVMQHVGFTEDELRQLRLEATMRADEVSSDFVPNMDIMRATQPHPAECRCPDCLPIDESAFDAEGQPKAVDPEQQAFEAGSSFPAPDVTVLAEAMESEDSEPVTFEDSLELAVADASDEAEDDDVASENVEAAEDPDAPQQISMF